MPPKKSSKKAPTAKATKAAAAAAAKQMKKAAEATALAQWIAENDPLLDEAKEKPIKLDDIFQSIVTRKSFAQPAVGQVPYDWSAFKGAVESRSAQSPRWFVQLREEDLLAGDDGMEGVTVNCFVVAETSEPTLAPAEYVVKVHWPYSDPEDNAPERILPITGQGMCWRRVVKNDGSEINMYLLQKREGGVGSPTANTAAAAPPPSAAAFGFGAAPSTATAAAPTSFGFGFGAAPSGATVAAPASFGFGFGTAPAPGPTSAPAAAPISFGFGAGQPQQTTTTTAPPAVNFGFGAPAPAAVTAAAPPPSAATVGGSLDSNEDGSVKPQPLGTAEVLFTLWSKKRLTSMAREVRSGSRIVREKFPLDAATGRTVKLVMENDRKDSVTDTVHRLILNRLFAKEDADVLEVDKWIADCPVYDEHLTTALQAFRERHVNEIADESEEFSKLHNTFSGKMEAELQRIVDIREKSAQKELDMIDDIMSRLSKNVLAEKSAFRLLKYYPKNDVQKFRPFGKVSGISEMGEMVDFCEPPAHVNINPFTGKPS